MFMQLFNNLDIQILNFTKHDVLGQHINDLLLLRCINVIGNPKYWFKKN